MLFSCLQEWVAVLSDDDEQDDDETLEGWAKLESMHSSSDPMYFAKKLAEVNINYRKSIICGSLAVPLR